MVSTPHKARGANLSHEESQQVQPHQNDSQRRTNRSCQDGIEGSILTTKQHTNSKKVGQNMKNMVMAMTAGVAIMLTGCSGGEVTATPNTSSSTQSSAPTETTSTTTVTKSAEPEDEVDCMDPNLSQSEWMESCEGVEQTEGADEGDPTVDMGGTYTYPDGLKVTITDWKYAGTDPAGQEYCTFTMTLENTGDEKLSTSNSLDAIYGDNGMTADESVAELPTGTIGKTLAPGAKGKATGSAAVPDDKEGAILMIDWTDQETFEFVRTPLNVMVNGGV